MKNNSLTLLADTYISPLLIKTLTKYKIPILIQNRKLMEKLKNSVKDLIILNKNKAVRLFSKTNGVFYTNSENILPSLIKNLKNKLLIDNIQLFKNKSLTRSFLKRILPTFFFLEVEKENLGDINLQSNKAYIIKPSVGFLSIGIRKIKSIDDIDVKINEIFSEIKKYSGTFDKAVLNPNKFLIEEYITGKEFACDAYFDSNGAPVILCIFSHPFLNEDDFRDVVYYTNSEIMYKMLPIVEEFLHKLSSLKKITNFPFHMEFRFYKNQVVPIEINPMRFAELSLADLPFFAFGINSYEYYFLKKKPDWDKILLRIGKENFFFVLGRVPEKLPDKKRPDHKKFKDTFKNLIEYYILDYRKYPVFAVAFGKTNNISETLKYLNFDFSNYFH